MLGQALALSIANTGARVAFMTRLEKIVALVLSLMGLERVARAVPALEPPISADAPAPVAVDTGVVQGRPARGYWSKGIPRWFVSTKSDLGAPYLKPYFSFGYGLPHWIWAGIDVNAITTLEFAQAYAGVRASSPLLDLAFGVRDTSSFGKPLLAPRASYRREDVLGGTASGARYWAWEAEVVAVAPLPHSAFLFDFIAIRTLDVPEGSYLYEESYRAVVAKPLFAVLRVAAVARLLREDALKVGFLSEIVFASGRETGVVRVGPAGALALTDHLEALGTLTLAVSSPDTLGLALGAYGVAGLRYRWATGEPAPKAPWRGSFIP
jgi:hypothetical protein